MSRRERDKGRRAEAEVATIYARHGFAVRGLEGAGDHLAIGYGLTIHSEVKRQEVLRVPLWTRQLMAEAPAGSIPILSYRRSRQAWTFVTPYGAVIGLLRVAGRSRNFVGETIEVGGDLYLRGLLEELLAALRAGAVSSRRQEALS